MIRLVSAATLAAFALLALALPATAQIMPTLKRDVVVTGDLVTIGDLIDHAGASASIAVFRAPDLGETGTVPASRVLEAVHRYNMPSIDIGNIADVTVTHDARVVTVADIRALIRREVNAKLSVQAETLSLTFDTAPHDVQIEATATAAPRIEQISFDPRSGRFDASIEVPGSAIARRLALRFTGSAVETVEVPVLTRTLARGDVIQDGDVALERRPKSETTGDVLGTSERAIGFSSRQGLARGRVLRRSDLTKPEIVKRNETVTIVFETPGILLTVRGTALDSGGVGDLINVTNVQSKRTVQAIVVGPGRVRPASMPAPTTVASAAPARSQQAE